MKRKVNKKKKRLLWFFGILGTLLLIALLFSVNIIYKTNKALEKSHFNYSSSFENRKDKQISVKSKDPVSFLLLGVDERGNDSGRSDTMIVITSNPKTDTMKMVSIPRDTYTVIQGREKKDKINHAYAFGGIELASDTVSSLLNIPIDYIIEINMEGLSQLVDTVGGVTINNHLKFDYEGYSFPTGTITLKGDQALKYVRMRYEDPEGDFGRQKRQRLLISALTDELISSKSIKNFNSILNTLGNNVQTNLTFSDITSFQTSYTKSLQNIEQIHFKKGSGKKIDGVWYYMMDDNELSSVSKKLRNNLELK